VDRVAGAICEARNRFFAVNVEHKVDGPDFDVMLARAAIEAMLVASPEMEMAGIKLFRAIADGKFSFGTTRQEVAGIYEAMISEALK